MQRLQNSLVGQAFNYLVHKETKESWENNQLSLLSI